MNLRSIAKLKFLIFFLLVACIGHHVQAQFKTPTGTVGGSTTNGSIEFTHNTPHAGLHLIRNSTTTMKSQLCFWQNTTEKWTLGIDPSENNTNSFYIYGGNTPDFRFFINPLGQVGINNNTPANLLYLKGGDITIEEVSGSALDGSGPGADLLLKDHAGGVMDIFSDAQTGNITLNGGSTMLQFFRYSTDHKLVIGNVTVPTSNAYRLYVEKGILTEKLKIAVSTDVVNWSDFVFDKKYKLAPLSQVETYVKQNKHLPEIPSAEEVYRDGIDVAQMDAKLLQKIEELTLYMIELEKSNAKLAKRLANLESQIK